LRRAIYTILLTGKEPLFGRRNSYISDICSNHR